MTATPSAPALPDRAQWGAALASQPRDAVCALGDRLGRQYAVEHQEVPTAGLAMMPVRDAVLNERFNLGEVPLSRAHVRLGPPHREPVFGGSAVLADDPELAVAIAVCDAVLAHDLDGADEVAALVVAGAAAARQRAAERAQMQQRSKVAFALLSQQLDDDDHA
jgi:alpha-D-ribose 1-methylphosphonate 5-triphosphate synthase subunit PhnG